ncbi:helix-hairpin-helix domain-containing protein [bacterium]|nr:helix-hairpin-helix domain-containing protein [bacterium]
MKRFFILLTLLFTVLLSAGELTVTFLNINQGDSILLSMPNGKHYLVDGGQPAYYDPVKDIYYSHFDAGKDIIVPYLKSHGIKKIDGILGTHPDADHIGGLIYVMNNFPVENAYYTGKSHTSMTYKNFMLAIKDNNIKYHEIRDEDILNWDASVLINVLGPTENEVKYPTNNNNTSIVLYIKYGNVKFLLAGDAEFKEESRIIAEYGENLHADILKFGHHGSKGASSAPFLKAVNPDFGILSCGANNKFGFPHKETLIRIYNENPKMKIVRTDYNGNISFITDGKTIKIEPKKDKVFTISEILKQENIDLVSGKKDYSVNVPADIQKVDINKANKEELISLPRVGPATAENILNYRKTHGAFKTIHDIVNVPRIGEKTFEKMASYIMVSGEVIKSNTPNEKVEKSSENVSNNNLININTASSKELETLPRVGPKTAQNIINYRNENGAFKTIHDITNVPRIGEKTFQNLKPHIMVSGEVITTSNVGSNKQNSTTYSPNIKKVNINTASQKELETLSRVGPKTAQNIINYRTENGPFKNIHDITNVPRIGEKTFQNLKPYITVSENEKKK